MFQAKNSGDSYQELLSELCTTLNVPNLSTAEKQGKPKKRTNVKSYF